MTARRPSRHATKPKDAPSPSPPPARGAIKSSNSFDGYADLPGWTGCRHDQFRAHDFVKTTFGASALDRQERVRRVLEEAIELAQAVDLPWQTLETITMHVYGKPKGDVSQKIAGVGVCLLALCEVEGLYLDRVTQRELQRIRRLDPEHFRARQAGKAGAGIGLMPDTELQI